MSKRESPLVGSVNADKVIVAEQINQLGAESIDHLYIARLGTLVINPQAPPPLIPHTAGPPLDLFIGREADMEALISMLRLDALPENPLDVVAIHGMPGVGKSALAIMLANNKAVQQALPEGILWASLGSEPDVMVRQAAWARELGEDLSACTTPDTRRRRLLSLLHDKKMLLVLDDVWDADSARNLMVGGPACRTLITTRNREIALALAGQQIYSLKPLTPDASLDLLHELAPKAVESNLEKAKTLAKELSCVPLALKLAGQFLQIESSFGLDVTSALVQMQDSKNRLALVPPEANLSASGEEQTLQAVFGISYNRLPDDHARQAFCLLGVYSSWPATFDLQAACDIWQMDSLQSKRALLILANRALIEPVGSGRFALHAILADYASSLLAKSGEEALVSARNRFAAHYLPTAKRYRDEEIPVWPQIDQEWENIRSAASWLCGRVLEGAAEETELRLAADYAVPLDYVIRSRKIPGAEKWLKGGIAACHRLGREEDEGWLTLTLGITHEDKGELDTAASDYQDSIAIFQKIDQQTGLAFAQGNLGTICRVRGEYPDALKAYEAVFKFCESQEDEQGLAIAHYNLADVLSALGNRQDALDHLNMSIRLSRQTERLQDKLALGLCLSAEIHLKEHRVETAREQVREASEIARSVGSNYLNGIAVRVVAEIDGDDGKNQEAEAGFAESLRLLEEADVCEEHAETAEIAGSYLARFGKTWIARQYLQSALNTYQRIGAISRADQVSEALRHL